MLWPPFQRQMVARIFNITLDIKVWCLLGLAFFPLSQHYASKIHQSRVLLWGSSSFVSASYNILLWEYTTIYWSIFLSVGIWIHFKFFCLFCFCVVVVFAIDANMNVWSMVICVSWDTCLPGNGIMGWEHMFSRVVILIFIPTIDPHPFRH